MYIPCNKESTFCGVMSSNLKFFAVTSLDNFWAIFTNPCRPSSWDSNCISILLLLLYPVIHKKWVMVFNATFNNISVVSFICRVNRSTWRKPQTQWRSLGLFSSMAIHRAQRGEKMLGGCENWKKKMGDWNAFYQV